jgi:hypothetical protein
MYLDLTNEDAWFLHKYIFKLKVPLNIKKIMWFLHGKVLLTKDNGRDVAIVVFVTKWRWYITCLSLVLLLALSGA